MKPLCLVCILVLGQAVIAQSQSESIAERHSLEIQISRKASVQYLLSFPADYKESKQKWPLILFLHGGSGRGDDISLVSRYGPPAVIKKRPNFPFVVLSPQCTKGEIWTDTELLLALLDDVISNYRSILNESISPA
jgi:predicted peptidase